MIHTPNVLAELTNPGLILLFLILFFGVIALITFILRNTIPGIKEKRGHIDEEVAVKEELDRILEPITDDEVLSAMNQDEDEPEAK